MDIYGDNNHINFEEKAKLVIHLIPFNSFDTSQMLDITELEEQKDNIKCFNDPQFGCIGSYSLNGILKYERFNLNNIISYTELYRSGMIETVDIHNIQRPHEQYNYIFGTLIEKKILKHIENQLIVLQNLDIQPPIAISISLLDLKGAVIIPSNTGRNPESESQFKEGFKQENIHLPDVVLEEYSYDIGSLLKLPFDSLWNASGHPYSPNCVSGTWEEVGHFGQTY
jgi:hypothetical protein